MPFIKVSENLFRTYAATYTEMDEGFWQKRVGHIVDINEFRFSFSPERTVYAFGGIEIVVTELESGCELRRFHLDSVEAEQFSTKEKVRNLFSNIALIVADDIEKLGQENFIKITRRGKTKAFEICGPMPEIKEVG